jgi:hypothetical protein
VRDTGPQRDEVLQPHVKRGAKWIVEQSLAKPDEGIYDYRL